MTVPEDLPTAHADATIYAFRRNVVVAASAGTGKTHRLTGLYLLLLLGLTSRGAPDVHTAAPAIGPERIVATTFSRAAAAEISSRVEGALRLLSEWDGLAPMAMADPIRDRLGLLGLAFDPGALRERAREVLTKWGQARVDTLHGVARRIVRRHALAIGLSPEVKVLDEEEAEALGDLAVDEALGAWIEAGGERRETARGLINSCGGVFWTRRKVLRLLDRLDEEGLSPKGLALADHLADAAVVGARLRSVAQRVAAMGSPLFREPAAALWVALRTSNEILPEAAVTSLVDLFTRRMPARGRRTPADDDLDALIGELPGKNKADKAAGLVSTLRSAPLLGPRERAMVGLLEDARDRLAAAKRRAGGLGFGDLLRLAEGTMRERLDVARAVRSEIDVLLVDEFQDTSRVQRDLVYLLRERDDAAVDRDPRAPPLPSALVGHGLFLVGDRKQSIYGFRGADVAVFSRIAAELAGEAAGRALSLPEPVWKDVEPSADFVALRESRRSGPEILDFVNRFSARDFGGGLSEAPKDFEIVYGEAEHLVPVAGAAPSVVTLVADDGGVPEGADPLVREAEGAAREGHLAAAMVAKIVERREASYRDVAILARRRSTIPLVELALGRLEIPYVVAGRALYDAPEVRDVAALLRLLLDPRDRLSLATVLRGPMVGLSDTSLAALSPPGFGLTVHLVGRAKGAEVVEIARSEQARLDAFRSRFADLHRAALRLPPGEAIRAAVSTFELDRALAALPRAEARLGNLDRLVGIARRREGTLATFVRWLERRIRDDADEAEAAVFAPEDDAVRLTTIHASKGLDFPVVILVDLAAEPRADAGGLGFLAADARSTPVFVVRHFARLPGEAHEDEEAFAGALSALSTPILRAAQGDAKAREQAERRRLTYVATTRAKRHLCLVGSAVPARSGSALASLSAGLAEGDLEGAIQVTEPAAALLAEARPAPPKVIHALPDPEPPARPARSTAKELALEATALGVFRGCARRYRLRHLLGLEEKAGAPQLDLFGAAEPPAPITDLPPPLAGDPTLDPRDLDRAVNRVLARWPLRDWGSAVDPRRIADRLAAEGLAENDARTHELAQGLAGFLGGAFAKGVRAEGAAVTVGDDALVSAGAEPVVRLRVAVDARIEDEGGGVDLLELRASRPRSDEAFALRVAALGEARARPDVRVRGGLVFLLGGPEPAWIDLGALEELEDEVAALGKKLAEARHEDRFPGEPVAVCRGLGCGFIGACHGAAAARSESRR